MLLHLKDCTGRPNRHPHQRHSVDDVDVGVEAADADSCVVVHYQMLLHSSTASRPSNDQSIHKSSAKINKLNYFFLKKFKIKSYFITGNG